MKRDDKKPEGEKSPEKIQKKRRGDDDEMDLDEQGGGKRPKQGSSVEKVSVFESVYVGCRNSPASPNEDNSLKLLRVGKWRSSSWPSECLEGGGPRYPILV